MRQFAMWQSSHVFILCTSLLCLRSSLLNFAIWHMYQKSLRNVYCCNLCASCDNLSPEPPFQFAIHIMLHFSKCKFVMYSICNFYVSYAATYGYAAICPVCHVASCKQERNKEAEVYCQRVLTRSMWCWSRKRYLAFSWSKNRSLIGPVTELGGVNWKHKTLNHCSWRHTWRIYLSSRKPV